MTSTAEPSFTFLPLGAIIQKFQVNGLNIVQGFDDAEDYKKYNDPYFGETIGRVANRISGAKIKSLNGRSYQLAANNGPNCLHGGKVGWGKCVFEGPFSIERNGKQSTMFKYLSKDGEEGFPGCVEARVYYTATTTESDGRQIAKLEVEYEAELTGDDGVEETVLAMMNHSYFNLAGTSSIEGTQVTLSTNLHQVVDDTDIPTGPIKPFPNIEANQAFTLGQQEPDVDHCFVLNTNPESIPIDTRSLPVNKLASFYHPTSAVHLEVFSTEPAFQFYTGKYIDVPAAGSMPARGPRSGFCVEPSRYVNATNDDRWKNMVLLKRGRKYGSRIVYRAWKDQ